MSFADNKNFEASFGKMWRLKKHKLMALLSDLAGNKKHCMDCRKVEKVMEGAKGTGKTKKNDYRQDKVYGKRLMIGKEADKTELTDNIRAARSILSSFPKKSMIIRNHALVKNVPNPEYAIDDLIADRKGILSENGVSAAFKKAIKQGCSAVVIDLDMHMGDKPLKIAELAKHIHWRHTDFENNIIKECYVIYKDKAIVINRNNIERELIKEELEKIRR